MPIKNPTLYGPDWPRISQDTREAAGQRCQQCHVANGAVGARDNHGCWWSFDRIDNTPDHVIERWFGEFPKVIKIVLTVHHLDLNPSNHDPRNLRVLCQRCHLQCHRADAIEAQRTIRRRRGGQIEMFEE